MGQKRAVWSFLAFVGLLLARDHPEQRGLAGPVRTDEADLFSLVEDTGGLDEENMVAILLADIVETNHAHTSLESFQMPGKSGHPQKANNRRGLAVMVYSKRLATVDEDRHYLFALALR